MWQSTVEGLCNTVPKGVVQYALRDSISSQYVPSGSDPFGTKVRTILTYNEGRAFISQIAMTCDDTHITSYKFMQVADIVALDLLHVVSESFTITDSHFRGYYYTVIDRISMYLTDQN